MIALPKCCRDMTAVRVRLQMSMRQMHASLLFCHLKDLGRFKVRVVTTAWVQMALMASKAWWSHFCNPLHFRLAGMLLDRRIGANHSSSKFKKIQKRRKQKKSQQQFAPCLRHGRSGWTLSCIWWTMMNPRHATLAVPWVDLYTSWGWRDAWEFLPASCLSLATWWIFQPCAMCTHCAFVSHFIAFVACCCESWLYSLITFDMLLQVLRETSTTGAREVVLLDKAFVSRHQNTSWLDTAVEIYMLHHFAPVWFRGCLNLLNSLYSFLLGGSEGRSSLGFHGARTEINLEMVVWNRTSISSIQIFPFFPVFAFLLGVLPKCLHLDSSTGIITWSLLVVWQQPMAPGVQVYHYSPCLFAVIWIALAIPCEQSRIHPYPHYIWTGTSSHLRCSHALQLEHPWAPEAEGEPDDEPMTGIMDTFVIQAQTLQMFALDRFGWSGHVKTFQFFGRTNSGCARGILVRRAQRLLGCALLERHSFPYL